MNRFDYLKQLLACLSENAVQVNSLTDKLFSLNRPVRKHGHLPLSLIFDHSAGTRFAYVENESRTRRVAMNSFFFCTKHDKKSSFTRVLLKYYSCRGEF